MRNLHGSRCSALLAIACVATAYAWQPRTRQRHHRTRLRAKRAKKVAREAAWAEKTAREAQDKARRKGRATDIAPAAVLANGVPIPEDHRFEQFFYDAPTSAKMMRLVRRFDANEDGNVSIPRVMSFVTGSRESATDDAM